MRLGWDSRASSLRAGPSTTGSPRAGVPRSPDKLRSTERRRKSAPFDPTIAVLVTMAASLLLGSAVNSPALLNPGTVPKSAAPVLGDASRAPRGLLSMISPHSTSTSATAVSLVPLHQNSTPGCLNATSASPSSLFQNLSLDYGNLSTDLWDLSNSSSGKVELCSLESPKGVSNRVGFSNAAPREPGRTVLGYPNINYGLCPWGERDPPRQNASALSLPVELIGGLSPPIWPVATYSISSGDLPVDFAFDIWLTPSEPVVSPTATCRANQHYLEVMAWVFQGASLPPEANTGWSPEQTNFATLRNGVYLPAAPWTAYLYCNSNVGATVSLLLDSGVSDGTVAVDLQAIIRSAVSTAGSCPVAQPPGAPLSAYWLDQIALGSEFTRGTIGEPNYSWDLYAYCLVTGVQEVTVSELTCPGSQAIPTVHGPAVTLELIVVVATVAALVGLAVYLPVYRKTKRRT